MLKLVSACIFVSRFRFVSLSFCFSIIYILVCYVCGGLAIVCVCLDLNFMWILSFCFAIRLDMLAFLASPFKTSSCRIFCRKLPNQTWNMTIVWAPHLQYVCLCVCMCWEFNLIRASYMQARQQPTMETCAETHDKHFREGYMRLCMPMFVSVWLRGKTLRLPPNHTNGELACFTGYGWSPPPKNLFFV